MYALLNAALEPTSRILGMDSQLAMSWGLQLLNTAIVVFILYKLLYKPVLEVLDARKNRIQGEIDNAAKLQKEAEELKSKYQDIMAGVEAEKSSILAEATKRAKEMEESIISTAKAEVERIKEAAAKQLELDKEKASRDMRTQIIDISALIASKYVSASIDDSLQTKLLNDAISDLGDATWLR